MTSHINTHYKHVCTLKSSFHSLIYAMNGISGLKIAGILTITWTGQAKNTHKLRKKTSLKCEDVTCLEFS